ncbi:MBL fold metallo-hydrolase RNA specificity domain-containing protein [Thermodesulfobacteriota bacterium]
MIRVNCLGGAGTVTGSNYLVETTGGTKVLVDCGLFQGGKRIESRNWQPWGFDPAQVQALFLTHAHIDHSGRIPKLVKDGFAGKIYTSFPTSELAQILLLDSAHIQEMEAEWQTKKNRRQAKKEILPLYTKDDAERSLHHFEPIERDIIREVAPGVRARLRNAGHILGSSILELWMEDEGESLKIVFSGDLGKKDQLIVKDPHEVFNADYLFIESTYGDRKHRSFDESKVELLEAIRYSYSHGQKVMIPAFAVERTQEILYVLGEFHRASLLPDVPVYLDSPLAIKATEIFRKNKRFYDEEAQALVDKGYDPFDMPNLRFTARTEESIAINEQKGPAIVIAGNGMCTAGRIKHHLKHNLWRRGASLVIVGFQAQGTTGRRIVDGAKEVKIFRETVSVEAKVFTIGGFSAHADQDDLVEWLRNFAESHPTVFIVHGEATASMALAQEVKNRFALASHIPRWKESLILRPRELIVEEPAEPAEEQVVWELTVNTIVDMENSLKDLKKRVMDSANRKTVTEYDLDRLRYIQEEIQSTLANQ